MPHQPTSRTVDGSSTAILFVHGIVGTPDHFLDLLPLIPDSWSYVNILLPGHGGRVGDFSRSSMALWRKAVTQQVDRLAATHQRVLLVGHSMGTLFCMDEALRRSDKVAGLFLLAPPLYPMLTPSATCQSLQVAFGLKGRRPSAQAAYRACSIAATPYLWQYLGWIPRYLELFGAARQGRAQAKQLSLPTVCIHSQHDELVSRRTYQYLRQLPHVTLHLLPSSRHFYYPPEDLTTLKNLFSAFLASF